MVSVVMNKQLEVNLCDIYNSRDMQHTHMPKPLAWSTVFFNKLKSHLLRLEKIGGGNVP